MGLPQQTSRSRKQSQSAASEEAGRLFEIELASNEVKIFRREIRQIREYRQTIGRRHTHPLRKRRGILLHANSRNHLSTREIVRGIQRLIWEPADLVAGGVQLSTLYGAAHDHLHAAPAVIGSGAVRLKRASEVRDRECRHIALLIDRAQGGIERIHRLRYVQQKRRMTVVGIPESGMQIESTDLNEENLPLRITLLNRKIDHGGDSFQLRRQPARWPRNWRYGIGNVLRRRRR